MELASSAISRGEALKGPRSGQNSIAQRIEWGEESSGTLKGPQCGLMGIANSIFWGYRAEGEDLFL